MFTNMKDRIIQFLKEMNLTSTKFADVIGVQRSSISHILSGRNKPSFDFIEKMLVAYPDIDAQWLITGKGDMYLNQPSLFNQDNHKNENSLSSRELNIQNPISNQPELTNSEQTKQPSIKNDDITPKIEKKTERVMVFYTDGTFKEYKSE